MLIREDKTMVKHHRLYKRTTLKNRDCVVDVLARQTYDPETSPGPPMQYLCVGTATPNGGVPHRAEIITIKWMKIFNGSMEYGRSVGHFPAGSYEGVDYDTPLHDAQSAFIIEK